MSNIKPVVENGIPWCGRNECPRAELPYYTCDDSHDNICLVAIRELRAESKKLHEVTPLITKFVEGVISGRIAGGGFGAIDRSWVGNSSEFIRLKKRSEEG